MKINNYKGRVISNSYAFSTDGRIFNYDVSLEDPINVGDYIIIEVENGDAFLGNVFEQKICSKLIINNYFIKGKGNLLIKIHKGELNPVSFKDKYDKGIIYFANENIVTNYFDLIDPKRSRIPIGHLLNNESGITVKIYSDGFNRHTFLCGQSGSGKSYALRKILEQLMVNKEIRILVLDFNSEFVLMKNLYTLQQINKSEEENNEKLTTVTEYDYFKEKFNSVSENIEIFRPDLPSIDKDNKLKINYCELSQEDQAILLGYDPLSDTTNDIENYHRFRLLHQQAKAFTKESPPFSDYLERIHKLEAILVSDYEKRIDNKQISSWELFIDSNTDESIKQYLDNDWRCLICDVGSFSNNDQKYVLTNFILNLLWEKRYEKKQTVIVIDEAHNVCPTNPINKLQERALDYLIRFAGEGRKFGLNLFLISQRPSKIHGNVLSQCENLILMKMNSRMDTTIIEKNFGFIPKAYVDKSPFLNLGEAVISGNIAPMPVLLKFSKRFTKEAES
jgi:uncharacterized protein